MKVGGYLCRGGDRIRTCSLQVMSLMSWPIPLPRFFPWSFFPTGVPLACLAGIEPAFRLRLGAEVGAPSLTDDWYELAESTSVEAKEEARGLSFQAKEQGMSALLLKRIRFLAPFYTQIPDWTSVHSLTYLSVDWCTNKTQNPWFEHPFLL